MYTMLHMDTCTIWITAKESNRIFKSYNITSSRHSTGHNNLRLNIMKASLVTVFSQYYTALELASVQSNYCGAAL